MVGGESQAPHGSARHCRAGQHAGLGGVVAVVLASGKVVGTWVDAVVSRVTRWVGIVTGLVLAEARAESARVYLFVGVAAGVALSRFIAFASGAVGLRTQILDKHVFGYAPRSACRRPEFNVDAGSAVGVGNVEIEVGGHGAIAVDIGVGGVRNPAACSSGSSAAWSVYRIYHSSSAQDVDGNGGCVAIEPPDSHSEPQLVVRTEAVRSRYDAVLVAVEHGYRAA